MLGRRMANAWSRCPPAVTVWAEEERELPKVFEATQPLLLLWGGMEVLAATCVTPSALPCVLSAPAMLTFTGP